MKFELKDLRGYSISGSIVTIQASNGAVHIAQLDRDVFEITYRFDAHASSSDVLSTRVDTLCNNRAALGNPTPIKVLEFDREYVIATESSSLKISRSTATISFYYNDKLIFGGDIGTEDTVLPEYPLRVQSKAPFEGKFNFCATDEDMFFGLGEKAGPLDKSYHRFKMFNRDALGYNPQYSDPLYISVPFFIQIKKRASRAAGVYFPFGNAEEFDFRVESNYYTNITISRPPFSYVLFAGNSYKEILDKYTKLTGRPSLPPRYAFGYFGSSMAYTDPDDAQARVMRYFNTVEKFDIPCEGMYFSSGYAKADNGERYTFIWNAKKFPNPADFIAGLKNRGYRICCNIKPGILKHHPWYNELREKELFLEDEQGQPFIEYYWSNYASFPDFLKEKTYSWWKEKIKKQLIGFGVEGIWNDNNEFEMEDSSIPSYGLRSILPILMTRCAYEALTEARPGERPWIISRSGFAGIQRYATTWTGDNCSDEASMLFSFPIGMNLGLSGIPFYGHDIGGFFGPTPSPELLLRWCQAALFQPRYIMHSWKPDGTATEPWMYPEIAEHIRDLIKLRYRFLPYFYSIAMESASFGIPMERPVCLEYPFDGYSSEDNAHLVGNDILVLPPQKIGAHSIKFRFPSESYWIRGLGGMIHAPASEAQFSYPSAQPLFFYRSGSVIPLNTNGAKMPDGYSESLQLFVLPLALQELRSVREGRISEDDGTRMFTEDSHNSYQYKQTRDSDTAINLSVEITRYAANAPRERQIEISVPEGFEIAQLGACESPARSLKDTLSPENPCRTYVITGKYSS